MSQIGVFNPETGKVEWHDKESFRPKPKYDEAPAIWGPIEYRGVGFDGAPMVTSRNQHKELLRRHNAVEVGDQKPDFMK